MQVHTDNIFKPIQDLRFEQTISHQCGITMNDSVEARAIAELMASKPGITVTYLPAMIRIDGQGKIEFKMSEISDVLGREMTPHLFEISTSTHTTPSCFSAISKTRWPTSESGNAKYGPVVFERRV
jgi:propane monooxygenase coupling protein